MKILLIIGSLPFGGAERVMSNLANYFVKTDDEVTLVTLKSSVVSYDLDININLINGVNGRNKLDIIYKLRKIIKKANQI